MPDPAPLAGDRRIEGLDVLRGLAVFGILVVNVEQMFLPMLIANDPLPVLPGERGALLAWFVTDALFENKFLTVFSLLFGAGFGLMWVRMQRDGRPFRRIYVRRSLVLIGFGLIHGVFFYLADVLMIYGATALLMLPWARWQARRLLWVGGALLATMVLLGVWLDEAPDPEHLERQREAVAAIQSIRDEGSLEHEHAGVRTSYELPLPLRPAIRALDGSDEVQAAAVEYAVYSRGPIGAAIFARVDFLAVLVLLYTPLYVGWRTLALFMLGAGAVKWGVLDPLRRPFWIRGLVIGLALGLPLTLIASAMRAAGHFSPTPWIVLGNALHDVSSLLLALGLGAGILVWAARARPGAIRRGLACVGRTALTNYIGQSVVMSLVATSYGLGWFGDLTRMQLLGSSVVCFLAQVAISAAWLRGFRMGPLEWAWRCATYGRRLPLVRTPCERSRRTGGRRPA